MPVFGKTLARIPRSLRSIGFATGVVAAVSPCMADTPHFTDGALKNGFMKTVFGAEYPHGSAEGLVVKKFNKPVRVYIDNRASIDRRKAVAAFVKSLAGRVPNLDIRLVATAAEANYRIYVVNRDQYTSTVKADIYHNEKPGVPGACLVQISPGPDGIQRSDAVIVSDQGEFLFKRCLIEETLQGLGPVNDDQSLSYSVFNDRSQLCEFTAHDRYIVTMLYDRRVRHGMSAGDVEKVLPAVIKSARKVVR